MYAIAMPSVPELILILVIVMMLFGIGKLPQVFDQFGKGVKAFKDAQRDTDVTPPKELGDKVGEAQEVKDKVR
jgi:sec-independent protein translocase protein TatA